MNWLELSLTCSPEAAEAVSEVFARYAQGGVAVEATSFTTDDRDRGVPVGPVTVRAYLPQNEKLEAAKVAIADGLGHLSVILEGALPAPSYRLVSEQDWTESWKTSFKPIRIGKRLLIVPAWLEQEARPGDIVVRLDPGMAFGTGTHPTTQLCLAAIERHLPAGQPVIDLGTGSGILAIAAVKLGAPVVWAYDIDEEAVRAAAENARENGVGQAVRVAHGSLADLRAQGVQAPFVLANILARVLVDLCGQGLGDLVAPGGLIVLSGILDTQAYQVRAALAQAGLTFVAQESIEDWVAILARRPQGAGR